MKSSNRVRSSLPLFSRLVMQWDLEINRRQMPWKGEKDPYRIWLSEVIMQQTRVSQGTPYYRSLIKAYPDIRSLAAADDREVMRLWQGLGYYSRCRNLLAAARLLVRDHGGKFPTNHAEILGLPGIGPYSAAAISSLAYNLPYAVLDGNSIRVLARFFGIRDPADGASGKARFSQLAGQLLDREQPGAYNQAIMDFGALVCTPKLPKCPACPLKIDCVAFREGLTALLPVKKKKTPVTNRYFHYLVIIVKGKLYLRRREQKDIWQNLYEFPLIETRSPDSATGILKSAAFRALVGKSLVETRSSSQVYQQMLTHRRIFARFITLESARPLATLKEYLSVPFREIGRYPLPRIIVSFLREINLS